MSPLTRKRAAFTLIELIVVIAILMVLIGIIVSVLMKAREAANRTVCANNLGQIGQGFQLHALDNKGLFPDAGGGWMQPRTGGGGTPYASGPPAKANQQDWGWAYQILPYIGDEPIWRDPSPNGAQARAAVIRTYFCPTRRRPMNFMSNFDPPLRGAIDYAANAGTGPLVNGGEFPSGFNQFYSWNSTNIPSLSRKQNGAVIPNFSDEHVTQTNIPDGNAATLLVADRSQNPNTMFVTTAEQDQGYTEGWDWDVMRWAYPSGPTPIPDRQRTGSSSKQFGSSHTVGIQGVFADGSVRTIRFTVSPTVFQALCNRMDGQKPVQDEY